MVAVAVGRKQGRAYGDLDYGFVAAPALFTHYLTHNQPEVEGSKQKSLPL